MKLIEFSLKRRVTVSMIAIGITLFGMVAFTRLPIPERRRLWNRERAPEISERFLRRILDTCEVLSVRQLLAVR